MEITPANAKVDTPGEALSLEVTAGMVVLADGNGGVRFYSSTEPSSLFADGFEGGDTLAWSATNP